MGALLSKVNRQVQMNLWDDQGKFGVTLTYLKKPAKTGVWKKLLQWVTDYSCMTHSLVPLPQKFPENNGLLLLNNSLLLKVPPLVNIQFKEKPCTAILSMLKF